MARFNKAQTQYIQAKGVTLPVETMSVALTFDPVSYPGIYLAPDAGRIDHKFDIGDSSGIADTSHLASQSLSIAGKPRDTRSNVRSIAAVLLRSQGK